MNDLPTGKFPDYNHNKYGDKPGQMWSADEQCRILLRDKTAVAYFATNADIAVYKLSLCSFLIKQSLTSVILFFIRSHVIQ